MLFHEMKSTLICLIAEKSAIISNVNGKSEKVASVNMVVISYHESLSFIFMILSHV